MTGNHGPEAFPAGERPGSDPDREAAPAPEGDEREAVAGHLDPGAGSVAVTVNGEPRQLRPGTTVADLVAELGRGPRGIAVAQNAVVVARSAWTLTVVATGDRIEVLHAVQGGC